MKKLWQIFAQTVTVVALAGFVVAHLKPHWWFGTGAPLTVEQLGQLGVKRISVGGSFARAALAGFLAAAREVQTKGTFSYAAEAVPHTELNAIFAAWPKN